jgi:hypothetical protein
MRSVDREFLYRKLSIVQNRMIELERANARSNLRWAVIGTIVGVIGAAVGIGFPVWDITHRPTEKAHLDDGKAIPESAPKSLAPDPQHQGP